MTNLGVKVPPLVSNPPPSYTMIATFIWGMVSLPFFYLAYLYWDWPHSLFTQWRGWVFAAAALGSALMAIIVPARYRLAIAGTKVLAWARLI